MDIDNWQKLFTYCLTDGKIRSLSELVVETPKNVRHCYNRWLELEKKVQEQYKAPSLSDWFFYEYQFAGKSLQNLSEKLGVLNSVLYKLMKRMNIPLRNKSEAVSGERNHMYRKHHSEETKRKLSEVHSGEGGYWYGKHLSAEHKKRIGEAGKKRTHSDETRRKISEALLGHKVTGITKRRLSEALAGYSLSEATRRKISEALRGEKHPNYGKHHSEETRRKMSEARRGYKYSEETRRKMSEIHKGYKHSEETRRKIRRKMLKARIGEKHPNWNGGSSRLPYSFDFVAIHAPYVRERDNHECQACGVKENGKALHVHHVNYNKKDDNERNLIALCPNCHSQTGSKKDRKVWTEIFQEKIEKIYSGLPESRVRELQAYKASLESRIKPEEIRVT